LLFQTATAPATPYCLKSYRILLWHIIYVLFLHNIFHKLYTDIIANIPFTEYHAEYFVLTKLIASDCMNNHIVNVNDIN